MRPLSHTREWKHPEGYRYLAPWTNAVFLRILVRKFTQGLARNEYRLKAQLDDAARSVVANIEEGYKRPTTKEYLTFLGYSQASLEEVKGDIRRACQDGFLKTKSGSSLAGIGIDLKKVREILRDSKGILRELKGENKGENLRESSNVPHHPSPSPNAPYSPLKSPNVPYNPLTSSNIPCLPLSSPNVPYNPLTSLKAFDLTLEVFIELINKTDFLMRQLVKSLEKKMNEEMPMSSRDKWLKIKMQERDKEEKEFDEELKRKIKEAGANPWGNKGF